jgi:hypothetical protein
VSDLKQQALTVAVLTALGERITEAAKSARADLLAVMQEVGAERVAAELPDGARVAAVSLAGSAGGRAYVADEAAFTRYVFEKYSGEMEYTIRPAFRKRLLDELSAVGEVVPGVELSDPKPYLSNRFASGGKDAVAQAWASGELDLPGLLAIEGGEEA